MYFKPIFVINNITKDKNRLGNFIPKTENQRLVSKNITISSKNIKAPISCGDATKTPTTFTICIVLNEGILKGLTVQGLTMTFSLAK